MMRFLQPGLQKLAISPRICLVKPINPLASSLHSFTATKLPINQRRVHVSATAYQETAEEAAQDRITSIQYDRKFANSVNLIGRTGRDIETKVFESGKILGTTGLCVSRSGGAISDWYDLVIWGSLASEAEEKVKKGTLVCVAGSLQKRKWTDRSNTPRENVQVNVSAIWLVQQPERLLSEAELAREGAEEHDGSYDYLDVEHEQQQAGFEADHEPFEEPYEEPHAGQTNGQTGAHVEPQYVLSSQGHQQHMFQGPFAELFSHYPDSPIITADHTDPVQYDWLTLFDRPDDWWDNRERKQQGRMKPRAPDFSSKEKDKDGKFALKSLWIDGRNTPDWVVGHLQYMDMQNNAPF